VREDREVVGARGKVGHGQAVARRRELGTAERRPDISAGTAVRGDADVAIADALDVRITARLQPRRRGRRIDMLRLDAAACWELASVNQPSVRSLAFA